MALSASQLFVSTLIHLSYIKTYMDSVDYIPVFFQASLGASPLRSSVDMLPQTAVIAPFALIAGVTVQVTSRYIPINILGWVTIMVGMGLMTLLNANINTAQLVGYQILAAMGLGFEVGLRHS